MLVSHEYVDVTGFCLAKTQNLVEASQAMVDSDEGYNAKDNALANIHLPCTQCLALSEDELVIAACTEDKINFYSVPALAEKGRNGTALLKSLGEECGIKVLAWNPGQRGVILKLSKEGKLSLGLFTEEHLKVVAEDVEAVDWSPDGEYFCYTTKDKNLHIFHSQSSSRSTYGLPQEMFTEAKDGGLEAYVDTLKWERLDSILVSCVAKDSGGEEDNSWIFVLASNAGPIVKDLHSAKIVSFEGFFTTIDSSILPSETGPYTLSCYIQPWELLIVTSRRCVDDHISLLGWFTELEQSEVYRFELVDERFTPRIELRANGDDNCAVGLAIDKTTRSIEIPVPNGDSGEKLKPGPILFCMTMEGNLSLFSIARMDNKGKNAEVLNAISELPEASKVLLYYNLDLKISDETAVVEGHEHESESSVMMAENKNLNLDVRGGKASGNDSWPDKSMFAVPRVENTSSQQLIKHPTTVMEVPDAKKQVSGETAVVEVPEHKSKSSVTVAEKVKSGLEGHGGKASPNNNWPDKSVFAVPRVENTNSQQLKRHLPFEMEAADTKKQDSLKELRREEVQAGHREFRGQRETQGPVDVSNRPVSSALTKTSNATALSEMESEFFRELNKVKDMATEIESLMNFIGGQQRLNKGQLEPSFTKTSVEEIQYKTRTMSKQCESLQVQLIEQRLNMVELRDECLQLDAWRVYVQSILEQVFDVRYKELWNKQTLHPELAGMRKRILQADQSLKQQISELEEHLHNLELYQWQKKKPPRMAPALSESKNFGCMQSLYDTVNTQMVVAQQLASLLALQSEILKLPPVAKEEIESSMNTSMLKLQSLMLQENPAARIRARLSSAGPSDFSPVRTTIKSSLQTPSKQAPPAGARAGLQDSTRRRRDSVDKLWVDVGAAKTTVKRAAPAKRFNGLSSPSTKDVVQGRGTQLQNEPLCRDSSPAMANLSTFQRAPQEERLKQARISVQPEAEALRAKEYTKPGNIDTGTVQSMKHKMPQSAALATNVVSTLQPLTTILTTAKNQVSPGVESMPQTSREQESQNVFLSNQVTYMGPSSIELTTQNTIELKVSPIETPSSIDFGRRDIFETAAVTSANHEKRSFSSRKSPVTSLYESQKKGASINLQNNSAVKQQQGPSGSLFMSPGAGINQSASQLVGSNPMKSANLHTEVGTGSVLTSSSPSSGNIVSSLSSLEQSSRPLFSLQIESHPNATSQGQSSSLFAPTSLAQPSSREPTREPWGSSSSESPSSSSLSTKPSNFMAAFSSVQETSSASTLPLPSAGVCSQTSPSFAGPSVLSVKPLNAFNNDIMPAEQPYFPSTASVSSSFLPVQGPPTVSDEEEMEEEANTISDFESNSFAGFGLESSSSATSQNPSPFGLGSSLSPAASKPSNPFGASSVWNQSSPSSLSPPAGQLFKPAAFSLPTPQLAASSATSTLFGNNPTPGAGSNFHGGHGGFGISAQPSAGFSNPNQPSAGGQQALGNALGSFGQTRQIGGPFNISSSPGGFALATGGGFAGVASGGGFAGVGAGGAFASAATGTGFGTFSAAGIGGSTSSNVNPGGFGAYSGGAFSAFSGGNTNSSIFTQMRK
ncbi:hypothetical protein GOP47_0003960 [Adiantum capillus-veneris]|uniref:Nucleoporin Nup159/Nup146 N-terminal domain-containing protein n=1 Tax=Adiantum capillus-veneris TaxID=13818 RepID=A0A9D4V790_ADICA|nr:hypothetical protein GOP47_0003960 [Adiantum capillus-veneris]